MQKNLMLKFLSKNNNLKQFSANLGKQNFAIKIQSLNIEFADYSDFDKKPPQPRIELGSPA